MSAEFAPDVRGLPAVVPETVALETDAKVYPFPVLPGVHVEPATQPEPYFYDPPFSRLVDGVLVDLSKEETSAWSGPTPADWHTRSRELTAQEMNTLSRFMSQRPGRRT